MRVSLLLSVALALYAAPVHADDDKFSSKTGPLIELTRQPRVLPQGVAAEFAGVTSEVAGPPKLVLTVKLPTGETRTFDVAVRSDNTFKHTFADTAAPGHYQTTWASTDRKTTVDAKFEVTTPAGFAQAVGASYDRAQTAMDGALAVVRDRVTALPPSPPRQELLSRLERLHQARQAHRAVRRQLVDLVTAAQTVTAIRPTETATFLREVADWTRQLDENATNTRQWIDRNRSQPSTCDSLDTAQEGLAFVSSTFNLATRSPLALIKNLWSDKVIPARIDQFATSDFNKLTLTEAAKLGNAAIESFDAAITGLGGIFGDLLQYATKQLFAAYCELLEGPVRGEFEVNMRTAGKVWWRHHLRFVGKLKLWYEKSQPASTDGYALHGKLEGNVTKIDFEEDIFLIEPPPAKNMLIRRLRFTPRVFPIDTSNDVYGFGAAYRALVPGAFQIRYAGRLKPATLQLTQQEALVDFTKEFANRSVVIASQPGIPVPLLKVFRFPMQKAKFILGRASKEDPLLPVTVDATPGSGKLSAATTLVRDETLSDGSTVRWRVTIDVASKK